jgi:hypothetical protein
MQPALRKRNPLTRREAITLARRSRKFRNWRRQVVAKFGEISKISKKPASMGAEYVEWKAATEEHFSPKQVALMWGLSVATIRRLFENEAGVLKVRNASGPTGRRQYKTLRIPTSVAARVHRRISA